MTELTDKEYRALPVESFSSIKYILDSPQSFLHFKAKPFKGSDASLLGTTIHNYLQGNKHLVAFNHIKRTTKKAKEEYLAFEEEFRSRVGEEGILVPGTFEPIVNSIMTNYNSNTQATALMDGCQYEVPYFFKVNDMDFKGKVDAVGPDRMVEIKTSSQATNALEFREEATERHYDLQAAMYLCGDMDTNQRPKALQHYFIVVNTQAPYKVAVYKSSPEFIKGGVQKLYEAVDRYNRFIIEGEKYDEEVESI